MDAETRARDPIGGRVTDRRDVADQREVTHHDRRAAGHPGPTRRREGRSG